MKRREFLGLAAGAIVTGPLAAAHAQESVRRIGVLTNFVAAMPRYSSV